MEKADEFKKDGNVFFKHGDYDKAIRLYWKVILHVKYTLDQARTIGQNSRDYDPGLTMIS